MGCCRWFVVKILICEVLGLFLEPRYKQNAVVFKQFYIGIRINACMRIFCRLVLKNLNKQPVAGC